MHLRDPTSWQQAKHQRMQTTLSHFRHVVIIGAPRNLSLWKIWTHLPEPAPHLRSGIFEKAFLPAYVLHHFCLAEKLRTLGESLPEMPPTFILALSSVCTIRHHVLHWGMKRFLLLIPAILSFHSFGFCHVFVLISHSLVEDHESCFQFSGSLWSLKCVCSCGF